NGERELAKLALGPEPTRVPSWSPNGRKLAYTNAVGCDEVVCETWEVWTVDVRNGARRRITQHGRDPTWSANSDRLVFNGDLRTEETAKAFIWTTKLVVASADGVHRETIGRGRDPVWAPRGDSIAFVRGGGKPGL